MNAETKLVAAIGIPRVFLFHLVSFDEMVQTCYAIERVTRRRKQVALGALALTYAYAPVVALVVELCWQAWIR